METGGNQRIEKSVSYLFIFLTVSENVGGKIIWNDITCCYSFLSESPGRARGYP